MVVMALEEAEHRHHLLDFAHVGLGGKQTNLSQPKLFMRNLYERCDVRLGSKADMCGAKGHVCFAPESGHVQCTSRCLLWANSGHSGQTVPNAVFG
jgi:hypothetical protein